MSKNWPLWEIFVRSKNGLEHREQWWVIRTSSRQGVSSPNILWFTRRSKTHV